MTIAGDGTSTGLLHRPGLPLTMGRSAMTTLAPPAATGGRYSLYRFDMQPRSGGPGPHLHRTFAESFTVLSGRVELFDGRAWVAGEPGDHLYVPEGVVHAFRHTEDDPASILVLSAPAVPREDYFAELADLLGSGRDVSLEELLDLWARHDTYPPS
jgi:mannose-6-phosphate isomerase-like protein (cupin superfamily)